MSTPIDARTFRDLLADPEAAETISAATGCPLVIVDADQGEARSMLAGLNIAALPAVVAILAPDPGRLPAPCFGAADVILTEDDQAISPFTRPAAGMRAGLTALQQALAANPVAGTALALLLRGSAGLSVPAGLVAESATYSTLQAGREFERWRSSRPSRPPEPGTSRVLTQRSDDELRITLSRPARRNALDRHMRDALVQALTVAAVDADLRVVLTAAGPDFCAGGDLDEFGSRPDPATAHLIRLTRSPALLMHRLSARTTVYLHGACLGAGAELPAFASRVVAAPGTRLGLPEVSLGLVPGAGGTVSLPRRVGRWRTAFLGLSGQQIAAEQALSWGLVDAVEPGMP
ncbi:MAG TPA: enoyl-CoA hydratase/isomerase family protein [Streptosporangiaceae bacterium]|nr:enoyl-CoA hydratase/isomerase family protein [Streptosporangiaceae bacterium]